MALLTDNHKQELEDLQEDLHHKERKAKRDMLAAKIEYEAKLLHREQAFRDKVKGLSKDPRALEKALRDLGGNTREHYMEIQKLKKDLNRMEDRQGQMFGD